MKLTSILLVSAMLAMALTVAATPTPKDEDSKSSEADESLDSAGSDRDSSNESYGYTEQYIKGRQSESQDGTVDGNGHDYCDIAQDDQPQCIEDYKCKYGNFNGDSVRIGKTLVPSFRLGTCVGKA